MAAKILNGNELALVIQSELLGRIESLKLRGVIPCLGVILIGDDPASHVYVGMKEKDCTKVGIHTITERYEADVSQQKVIETVDHFNADKNIHGILVQLPLPGHLDEEAILLRIDPNKDVDGLHPYNIGRLAAGSPAFIPCTPAGILQILLRSGYNPSGKHAVVVGRSNIVGKPIAALLARKADGGNATVTICHSRTSDIALFCKSADILVSAIGSPEFITGDMLSPGAVVIDVGVNRVDDANAKKGYRLVGDVEYNTASKIAQAITPVPGGVGPMTRAMLLSNVIRAAEILNQVD